MKKIILLLMLVGLVQGAFAQPEARRRAQQKAQNKSNANDMCPNHVPNSGFHG